MRLLKISFPKRESYGVGVAIRSILKKYPDADNESIFATIIKAGMTCSFSNISSTKSAYFKEKRIRELVGVK